MRVQNIKINLEIPAPIDMPDDNGVTYSEEAIIQACQEIYYLPIVTCDKDGNTHIIGTATDVTYSNDKSIIVSGVLFWGGTEEFSEFDDGRVIKMDLASIGLSFFE